MKSSNAILLPLFLLMCSPVWGQEDAVPLQQGNVLAMYFIQPRADADQDASEEFLKNEYFPTLSNEFPESRLLQLRGERGQHEERTAVVWLYPDTPTKSFGEEIGMEGQPELEGAFYRFNDGLEDSLSTQYRVIEAGKPLNKGMLQAGAILGLHHIVLKPDVDPADFEEFIHRIWAPNRSDALPNSKMVFLKGIAGQREGEYSYLWIIDSEETRDYYFPSSGVPSHMYTEFETGWSWMDSPDYLGRFLANDVEDVFTDYVVVQ